MISWLKSLPTSLALEPDTASPASSDASFRRYFRVNAAQTTYIVMDAPVLNEDCRPFIAISQLLQRAGSSVPKVLHQDLTQGFLLLTDFGNTTYLEVLNEHSATALYTEAMQSLVQFQSSADTQTIPKYDDALLRKELALYPDWYIKHHRQITLSNQQQSVLARAFDLIVTSNLKQPTTFVHRDYHSRNLMLLRDGNPGILDFQDAVCGPITYDLVSLLRDAYINWTEEQVLDWTVRYWEMARKANLPVNPDFSLFYRDFEWMGLQRHLKVLGIFARLNYRDGKSRYLNDMPLVLNYVIKVCDRYIDLNGLSRLIQQIENKPASTGLTF
jgi:N-acetylmuramate 1-kinase